jgi:hypothetical protein
MKSESKEISLSDLIEAGLGDVPLSQLLLPKNSEKLRDIALHKQDEIQEEHGEK